MAAPSHSSNYVLNFLNVFLNRFLIKERFLEQIMFSFLFSDLFLLVNNTQCSGSNLRSYSCWTCPFRNVYLLLIETLSKQTKNRHDCTHSQNHSEDSSKRQHKLIYGTNHIRLKHRLASTIQRLRCRASNNKIFCELPAYKKT